MLLILWIAFNIVRPICLSLCPEVSYVKDILNHIFFHGSMLFVFDLLFWMHLTGCWFVLTICLTFLHLYWWSSFSCCKEDGLVGDYSSFLLDFIRQAQ